MEVAELIKKVRKIEIKTKGLTNHIFSGEYHSAFKGRGMSFSEVREYQYGDDIRNIDWNVTARFQHPYVKIFEEERELTIMLLIDVSKSAFIGTQTQLKNEIMAEIAGVLAFSAIQNNDKVGVLFFSDAIEMFIPPKKGKSHILRIIREILNFEPKSNKTNISLALESFNNMVKRKSIAFVLSDFIDENYANELRHISKKHDVIGVKVYDNLDMELPNIGLLQVQDVETGETKWLDTKDKQTQKAYSERASFYDNIYNDSFVKAGADKLKINTAQAYVHILMNFFKKRA
ncbi:MAG TPA: DUF58 domain-containing protein [Chitinophagales bacterium]|nr:DUF58 domain-containing protein [Chitinophagales bacterium]HMW11765.1 DUF58 domain-containing protein [Chitinophagales bacterium]HMX59340.1 DUF58 domain-containing protein [Chitinophagales bacterium]HMY24190.1 DUF58 domain-containing protein [Chitinophagales bacterium]HMZ32719.1 DUF58 domain-containing protein [Chitinophagales bacterium]